MTPQTTKIFTDKYTNKAGSQSDVYLHNLRLK